MNSINIKANKRQNGSISDGSTPAKRKMKSYENEEGEDLFSDYIPVFAEDTIQTITNPDIKPKIYFEDPKGSEGWSPHEIHNAIDIFTSEGKIRTPIFAATLEPNSEAESIQIRDEELELSDRIQKVVEEMTSLENENNLLRGELIKKEVKQKEMQTHYDWLIKYMNDKLSGSEHEEKCKKDSLITKLQNENQKLKRENQSFIKELANKDVKINKLSDEIQSVKMRNVEEIALNIAAASF